MRDGNKKLDPTLRLGYNPTRIRGLVTPCSADNIYEDVIDSRRPIAGLGNRSGQEAAPAGCCRPAYTSPSFAMGFLFMSLKAIVWAFAQDSVQSASQKFVLVALANFASETGKTYPSVETIRRITNQKEETVAKALRALIGTGHIADTGKRAGPTQRVKVYQLPDAACEIPPRTGVFNTPQNGGVPASNTPPNTPLFGIAIIKEPRNIRNRELALPGTQAQKQMSRPTLQELSAYGISKGLPAAECEACYDHYVSNGWKVGKNPMKDWQAAVRNWKRQRSRFTNGKPPPNGEQWVPGGGNL